MNKYLIKIAETLKQNKAKKKAGVKPAKARFFVPKGSNANPKKRFGDLKMGLVGQKRSGKTKVKA